MNLHSVEGTALEDAGRMIKYAAESAQKLPGDIVTPIANAWKAEQEKAWEPATSAEFWVAYSALCDLLKPVTLDTIDAKTTSRECRRWLLFGDIVTGAPLPQRTASFYRGVLIALLVISVMFGYLATTCNKLSEDLKEFMARGNTAAADVAAAMATIKTDLDGSSLPNGKTSLTLDLNDSAIKAETRAKITAMQQTLQDMYYAADMMNNRIDGLRRITPRLGTDSQPKLTDLSELSTLQEGYAVIQNYYKTRRSVSGYQQGVYLFISLYNAFVPVLLGAIGACTYVLRMISEQIRDTTFATTSPVRHSLRVFLGILAGVVVGLGGIITNSDLSTSALAFIAGYAVEPVFSTMDSISEKFRRDG